jgi:hypothetical protein
MASCGIIARGVSKDCYNPPVAGLKDRAIIINKDDLLAPIVDEKNPLKISSLLLKAGKKGYLIEGINNTLKARDSAAASTIGVNFTHEFDFVVLEAGPDAVAVAQEIAYGRYVVVYPDNNNNFRVMGLNAGLKHSAGGSDSENTDLGGSYAITLMSDREKGYAPFLTVEDVTDPANPVYDYNATEAVFESLLVAAS